MASFMRPITPYILSSMITFFGSGCHPDLRLSEPPDETPKIPLSATRPQVPESDETKVYVYKFDGAVQCQHCGVPLGVMEKELLNAGVQVFFRCKSSATEIGTCAACGCGTTSINAYLVARQHLSVAQAWGFNAVPDKYVRYRGTTGIRCSPG